MTLAAFKKWFDPHLETILNEKITSYCDILGDDTLADYCRHIKPLTLEGGKRGRPYGAWLMYYSAGGQNDDDILPILVALELFHLFCLIHDDIIDNGEKRHGVATLHTYIGKKTKSVHGKNQAILLGDLLFNLSHELFHRETALPSENRSAAYRHFLQMVEAVILGQMIDVETTIRPTVTWKAIETKMDLKTATYTFVYPLKIGVALAQTQAYELDTFATQFGRMVGIAYQIQDDLLDCGTHEVTKTPFRDISEHQHTYLTQYVMEHGTDDQKQLLQASFGHEVTADMQTELRRLFTESGAIAHAQEKVTKLFGLARNMLTISPLPSEYVDSWHQLLDLLSHRQH